jgi:hypothetical protein
MLGCRTVRDPYGAGNHAQEEEIRQLAESFGRVVNVLAVCLFLNSPAVELSEANVTNFARHGVCGTWTESVLCVCNVVAAEPEAAGAC